jgi:hypothetical protein
MAWYPAHTNQPTSATRGNRRVGHRAALGDWITARGLRRRVGRLMAAAGNDSGQAPIKRRAWRIRVRLLLVIAALFAGATALGGGAGFAVGKIASIGASAQVKPPHSTTNDGNGRTIGSWAETSVASERRHLQQVEPISHVPSTDQANAYTPSMPLAPSVRPPRRVCVGWSGPPT